MPHVVFAFFASLLLTSGHAIAQDLERAQDYSTALERFCRDTQKLSAATFVLIDGTDKMGSEQWIRERIFEDEDLISLDSTGDKFFIGYLRKKLEVRHVCAPPSGRWGILKATIKSALGIGPSFVQGDTKMFSTAYNRAIMQNLQALLDKNRDKKASSTPLLETIVEIFTAQRYGMTSVSEDGQRTFILASDLFQYSRLPSGEPLVSFYEICTRTPDGSRKCPPYKDLIKEDSPAHSVRVAKYLKGKTPMLRWTDRIYLFNITVEGRVDQSAKDFWMQYFEETGVNPDNIRYDFEGSR